MTFREYIKHRHIIAIDLLPSRDVVWAGVCVKSNKQITVFINLDKPQKRLDGFTVFRSKEISRYRLCDKNEYRGMNQSTVGNDCGRLNLREMVDIPSSLRAAATQGLIAFFVGNDTKSYYVGKLVSLHEDLARFRLVDKNANFTRYKAIKIQNINYFSFACEYERLLARQLENQGPTIVSCRLGCHRVVASGQSGKPKPKQSGPSSQDPATKL